MKPIQLGILSLAAMAVFAAPVVSRAAPEKDGIKNEDYNWWRKARFGVFIHWGPSSLLNLGAGSWMRAGGADPKQATNKTDFDAPFTLTEEMRKKYHSYNVPQEIYDNMYKVFNPTEFDAKAWAKTFKDAGAGYVVFTSKHHDGFCMFDTKATRYNIMNSAYGRDIAKQLSDACAEAGLKVLWYYSVVDWYNPLFDVDNPKPYEDYLVQQVDELFGNYKDIAGIWWDGGGIKIDNDRVWRTIKKHCAHPIGNGRGIRLPGVVFGTPEQELGSFNLKYPWESCVTIMGEAWFWNGGKNLKTTNSCLRYLIDASGGDGNLLLDFGPDAKGRIYGPVRDIYLGMGRWLKKYGESIYGARGGPYTPGHWGISTRKDDTIYLHITQVWPGGVLELPALPAKVLDSKVLTGGTAKVVQSAEGLRIEMDAKDHATPDTIIALKVDKPAMDIPVVHCDLGESMSRDAKVTASSELKRSSMGMAGGVVEYSIEYGKDGKRLQDKQIPEETKKKMPWITPRRGHVYRYWMADPKEKEPWLQLSFDKPKTFQRIDLFEKYNRIESYEVQILQGDEWKTVHKGGELALTSILLPEPVTTKSVRVVVHSWHSDNPTEGPGIREVDIFEK